MKVNTQNKVYKISYGATPVQTRNNGKPILNEDISNFDGMKILAKDVYDALEKTEKYLLKKEKQLLKEEGLQLFVESVELVTYIEEL